MYCCEDAECDHCNGATGGGESSVAIRHKGHTVGGPGICCLRRRPGQQARHQRFQRVLHSMKERFRLCMYADKVRSIRYAAPPIGNLRFAAPQPPPENRTVPIAATSNGPICPQTGAGKDTPAAYGFNSGLGNEDCLWLNVYAPSNATNLPVFFWIRKFALCHQLQRETSHDNTI